MYTSRSHESFELDLVPVMLGRPERGEMAPGMLRRRVQLAAGLLLLLVVLLVSARDQHGTGRADGSPQQRSHQSVVGRDQLLVAPAPGHSSWIVIYYLLCRLRFSHPSVVSTGGKITLTNAHSFSLMISR